jgi:hypothetical protein
MAVGFDVHVNYNYEYNSSKIEDYITKFVRHQLQECGVFSGSVTTSMI